jgi:hypothetical protein
MFLWMEGVDVSKPSLAWPTRWAKSGLWHHYGYNSVFFCSLELAFSGKNNGARDRVNKWWYHFLTRHTVSLSLNYTPFHKNTGGASWWQYWAMPPLGSRKFLRSIYFSRWNCKRLQLWRHNYQFPISKEKETRLFTSISSIC